MAVVIAGDEFAERAGKTLYTEALLLADESRAYFEGEGRCQRDALDPYGRVQFACEALKATTRLLQVIAWSAARRAGGEPALAVSSGSEQAVLGRLPTTARRLILAGIDLHERTGRLAGGGGGVVAIASPARALIQRLERSM